MRIELRHVHFIPKEMEPGVLYVAAEFGAAAHLCACGCGAKIRTPLSPTEWALDETTDGPTLRPSIGNWQQTCESHYWIWRGEIFWSGKWTPEQIAAGRRREEERRRDYFGALDRERASILRRFWRWLSSRFAQ